MMLFGSFIHLAIVYIFAMVPLATPRPHNITSHGKRNSSKGTKSSTDIDETLNLFRILTRPGNPSRGDIISALEGVFSEDQDIIFPDSYEDTFDVVPKIDGTPKCAVLSTYCEEIDSYPYGHLKEILRRTNTPTGMFGTDEASDEIANRLGEQEDVFLCAAKDKTIFPKVGKTKTNKWKYIINQGDQDGYIQGVRVETCDRMNGPCDLISYLPTGYVTSCKQKYVYRRMISLSEEGHPITDTFQMPSACCCSYRRDSHYLERFGSPVTQADRKR